MKGVNCLADFTTLLDALSYAKGNLPCVVVSSKKYRDINLLSASSTRSFGSWQDDSILYKCLAKGYQVLDFMVLDQFALGERVFGLHDRFVPPLALCVLLGEAEPTPSRHILNNIQNWQAPFQKNGATLPIPCVLSNISDFALNPPSLADILNPRLMPFFKVGAVTSLKPATSCTPALYQTQENESFFYALPINFQRNQGIGNFHR